MNRPGSAVVSVMAKASHDAWKKWRKLVDDGRAPVVMKTNLRPAIDRSTRAVEKARAT